MKYFKLKYLILTTAVASLLFSSCIKDDVVKLTSQGSTFVKIGEAPENKLFFAPFSEVKPVALFTIRRDANSSAELQTTASVKLQADPAAVDTYNDDNGTDFEWLPDSLYTLGEGINASGDTYTVDLGAGDFAKDFSINLDGSKWDLSRKYAVAFNLTDAGGKKISSGMDKILVLISVKNKYDGVYTITGSFTDVTNPAFAGIYPLEWELQTSGPNQCIVVDNVYLGIPGYVFSVDGTPDNISYFGSFGLVVNFDPETDAITSIENYYGQPAGNTRGAELDPTGVNAYDPDSKTIKIKYFMTQPSVVTAPPYIRCMFDEEWKYEKPRQ